MNHRYIDFVPNKHRPVERQVPFDELEGEDFYEEPEPVDIRVASAPADVHVTSKTFEEPIDEPGYSGYRTATVRHYESDDLKGVTVEEILVAREEENPEAKTFEPEPMDFGLGMVEDYTPVNERRPAFINTAAAKVEKRPLGFMRKSAKAAEPATDLSAPDLAAEPAADPAVDLEDELKVAKSEDLKKRPLHFGRKPAKTAEATEPVVDSPAPAKTPEFKKPTFINTHLVEKRPLSKTDYRNRVPVVAEEDTDGPVTIIDKPEKDSRLGFILTIIITILLGAAVGTVAFLLIPK